MVVVHKSSKSRCTKRIPITKPKVAELRLSHKAHLWFQSRDAPSRFPPVKNTFPPLPMATRKQIDIISRGALHINITTGSTC